jgi:hypothetical protein
MNSQASSTPIFSLAAESTSMPLLMDFLTTQLLTCFSTSGTKLNIRFGLPQDPSNMASYSTKRKKMEDWPGQKREAALQKYFNQRQFNGYKVEHIEIEGRTSKMVHCSYRYSYNDPWIMRLRLVQFIWIKYLRQRDRHTSERAEREIKRICLSYFDLNCPMRLVNISNQ